jgi:hypothetical protein
MFDLFDYVIHFARAFQRLRLPALGRAWINYQMPQTPQKSGASFVGRLYIEHNSQTQEAKTTNDQPEFHKAH